MAPFFLFPVAVGVNYQQRKYDHAADGNNDHGRLVSPNVAHEFGNVRNHHLCHFSFGPNILHPRNSSTKTPANKFYRMADDNILRAAFTSAFASAGVPIVMRR